MRRAHGPHKVEGVSFWHDDWCRARSHSELLCPPGRSAFCDLHVLGLFCEVSMIRPPQSTQRCADGMMLADVTARFCAISSRVAYGMYPGGTEARNAIITVSRVPCLLIAPCCRALSPVLLHLQTSAAPLLLLLQICGMDVVYMRQDSQNPATHGRHVLKNSSKEEREGATMCRACFRCVGSCVP